MVPSPARRGDEPVLARIQDMANLLDELHVKFKLGEGKVPAQDDQRC